jgi:hypothetical protein
MTQGIAASLVIALGLFLGSDPATAQQNVCGSPPPVANEYLRAELGGKARLITPLLGTPDVTGAIEVSRTEVFSKYPEAEQGAFKHLFRVPSLMILMTDRLMTAEQKVAALERIRTKFNPQRRLKIVVSPIGPHINNRDIGLMSAASGRFRYYVDEQVIRDNQLVDAFGTVELDLIPGIQVVHPPQHG